MSQKRTPQRRRTLLVLAAIAAASWGLIGLTAVTARPHSDDHARQALPVLPGFAETRATAAHIRFTMADDTYTLTRTAAGWVMDEAGGFPIRTDRLAALATGLESLTYGAKRTSDPEKLDRIGLGDPGDGGNGVVIDVIGPQDEITQSLVVGRKDDQLYVRAPDDTQTYRANGELPPFYTRRAWLDFDIIDIDPSAISSVRIVDSAGQSLYLRRAPGSDARSFRPAPPNEADQLLDRLAASSTALAITRLSALDAKPATALETRPIARHISETFDGLEVDLSAWREPDGLWVTLRAVEAGEGARRAQAINDKAEGWAFRVSEYDFQDFTPRLAALVERAD